jgi:hypothetical protein
LKSRTNTPLTECYRLREWAALYDSENRRLK